MQKILGKAVRVLRQAFVRSHKQVHRFVEKKGCFVLDETWSEIRGYAQDAVVAYETQMIAADADARLGLAVIEGRTDANRDAGLADNRFDAAHDPRRAEIAFEQPETRREVDYAERLAGFRFIDGFEDRGVADVGLVRRCEIFDENVHEAGLGIVTIDQRIEDRVAVQPGEAEPFVDPMGVDETRHGAVSDRRKVELSHDQSSVRNCFSHARTAAGSPPNATPTSSAMPPFSSTARKPS